MASQGIPAGLRQMGAGRALAVLIAGFIAISAAVGLLLLVTQPVVPITIHVRWGLDVDEARRATLERELSLTEGRLGEGRTWIYRLPEPSSDRLRRIVEHAAVEDTEHVNRRWFRPEFSADRERRAIFYGALSGAAGAVALLLWLANRRAERIV